MANWVTPPSAVTSAPTNDPLVPYDFSSLFDRIVGIVKRSWRSLLAIQAVGTLVPTAVVLTVVAITGLGSLTVLGPTGTATTAPLSEEEIRRLLATLAGAGVALLLLALVASYVAAAASAASIWTVTRQAAGQPAPFGEAFRYGFRRALSLFGWNLLSGLCIAVGLLCCILPGVYLGVALSLIAPIVVFEGGNAFSRSFRLVHSDFWPVAGRVVLVYLAYLAFSFIVDVPNTIVSMVPMEPSAKVVVGLVVQLITAALTVPGAIALLVGLTMVYTEVRARQEHLSTPQLVTELDHA